MLKKVITVGLVIFTLLLLISTAGCVNDKQTYVIGIMPSVPPWEYVDDNGNAEGFSVDVLKMIAKEKGVNFEFVTVDLGWEQDLLNGKIDGKTSLVKTPQREEVFAFANSPLEDVKFAAVSRDGSPITVDDVLSGKASIAVQRESGYDQWLKSKFGDKYDEMVADGRISLEQSIDYAMLAVLSGKTDTAIAGDMSVSYMLSNYPTLNFVGYLGETAGGSTAVLKGNTELLNILNDGMDAIESLPEYNAIIDKYNIQVMKNKYSVGIDAQNVPWTYIGDDGEYTGFDIEMIQWIADKYGFDLVFKPYRWDNNINALVVGNLDIWASSMTITPARMNSIAFSKPYYSSGIGVLVRSDSTLTEADFLNSDAKIVTAYGTTYVPWVESKLGTSQFEAKLNDGSINFGKDCDESLEFLLSGDYDFYATGSKQMEAYVRDNNVKILLEDKDIEQFGIATNNGNIVLQDMINKGIEEFEKSGKKAELLEKYDL